jgi:hypothetical protein
VTHFTSDKISRFDWSRDGRLALYRGTDDWRDDFAFTGSWSSLRDGGMGVVWGSSNILRLQKVKTVPRSPSGFRPKNDVPRQCALPPVDQEKQSRGSAATGK